MMNRVAREPILRLKREAGEDAGADAVLPATISSPPPARDIRHWG